MDYIKPIPTTQCINIESNLLKMTKVSFFRWCVRKVVPVDPTSENPFQKNFFMKFTPPIWESRQAKILGFIIWVSTLTIKVMKSDENQHIYDENMKNKSMEYA